MFEDVVTYGDTEQQRFGRRPTFPSSVDDHHKTNVNFL